MFQLAQKGKNKETIREREREHTQTLVINEISLLLHIMHINTQMSADDSTLISHDTAYQDHSCPFKFLFGVPTMHGCMQCTCVL